jgi:hypothetical protein
MTKKTSSTKSKKANTQPSPEGGPESAPASGTRKTRRPSPELKAEPDRTIAKREKKARKGSGKTKEKREPKERQEDLVVFAFRLSEEERELIHKAAGPARASKFVRALAVAAACNDEAAIKLLLQSTNSAA